MNKKNILIIVSILTFIAIVGGISYSYFVYNKNIGDVTLTTGEISIDLSGVSGNKTLSSVIPLSDNDGKNTSDYFDFTVNSSVDTERIYYEVYLLPQSGNTLDTNYLKTYLTDQNNVEIKGVTYYSDLGDSEVENGKVLYKGIIEVNQNGESKTETKDFRLRLWIDDTFDAQTSKLFDFDIYLYAKNVDANFVIPYGANLLRKAVGEKEAAGGTCANITYVEDEITYFSGTNDCVDMNYVWYSGKLWRITQIYPDGAMKLVTQNNITSIVFNISRRVNFYTDANTTSYLYQWLNEDFYDTLHNANQFIDTTKQWNATPANTTISTKPLETNMVAANVGLLNNYDYYNSYRCIGQNDETCLGTLYYSTGYLNIGYYWWLLNPYSASDDWIVNNNGGGQHNSPTFMYGVRPSIYLKSGLEFTGEGTNYSPYRIVGDKETGQANELINTRLSGEYIKLDNGSANQVFRIIGVEDNKTKIIAMDYADNSAKRTFATSTGSANSRWGNGTTTDIDTWYTYLNTSTTGYLDTLKSTFGEFFDSGLYYYGSTVYNYKLSVCANTTSGNTKVCDKTDNKGTFNIGLPRYGEIFATQQAGGYSNSIKLWLMSENSASCVWYLYEDGNGTCNDPTNTYGARPTLHLKSTVKIISGTGTEQDPYVVGL